MEWTAYYISPLLLLVGLVKHKSYNDNHRHVPNFSSGSINDSELQVTLFNEEIIYHT